MNMSPRLKLTGGVWIFLTLLICFTSAQVPDTLNILAIRVEFAVDNSDATTGDGRFDLGAASGPYQIDPPPHNRTYFQDHLLFLKNYYDKISDGQLVINGTVYPAGLNDAYQLSAPMTDYNPNTSPAAIDEGIARLLRDALQLADQDPAVDFSRYNSFIVFHAGVGRDIDLGFDDTPQDIPSLFVTSEFLQRTLGVPAIILENGTVEISNGIILPETESQEGLQLGLNGILTSNIGSQLGWLDLFSPETGRSGVGRFGLMDAGLFNGDGLLPAIPTAWTRIEAGWETPQTISQAQQERFDIHHTLSAIQPRVLKIPINDREYFLIENRNAGQQSLDSIQFVLSDNRGEFVSMREVLATQFQDVAVFSDSSGVLIDIDNPDRGLPGGGILIWHIDENIIDANRAANRINADPDNRGVDLEEADGSQDLGVDFEVFSGGSGSEIGTALDPWFEGNIAPVFEESPAGTFSINSVPDSRSNYNRANSHITLSNFSGRAPIMSLEVTLNIFQDNFPMALDVNQYGSVTSTRVDDFDGDGDDEILLTTTADKLLMVGQDGPENWGGGTLQILDLSSFGNISGPPAIFNVPASSDLGIVLLTTDGQAIGYRFNRIESRLDSLFRFQTTGQPTTFPLAIELGGPAAGGAIYWGDMAGSIYQISMFSQSPPTITTIAALDEPVKHIRTNGSGESIFIGANGKLLIDGNAETDLSGSVFYPVGENPVVFGSAGELRLLRDPDSVPAESGAFRFDADPISLLTGNSSGAADSERFFAVGQNRLYALNYNLTQVENFPQQIYQMPQQTHLSIAPLAGYFEKNAGENVLGIVVADPAGLISAFDLEGELLPDFPVALGDSIAGTPALLDIDGDDDLELSATTQSGQLYVWDFFSGASGQHLPPWPQQYGAIGNQNRQQGAPVTVDGDTEAALLAADRVYNWPNPNIDNHTFIRYRLSAAADVSIKIFDLAGDLVTELNGTGNPNTDNEVRWDLSNVQSGVYIGRIQANGDGKNETRIIKIAVVK